MQGIVKNASRPLNPFVATEQMKVDKGVSKLAREMKVSPSLVSRRLLAGETPDEIRASVAARRAEEAERGTEDNDLETLTEARARKARADASMHELSLAIKRGELVSMAEVNAYVAGMIMRARDILLRIAPELRDRLSQETDPINCEELISAEVNRALRGLAEYRVDHD